MSAIVSLSRPGRCAGCVPLHLLISKLLRSGEHLAARTLQSLPECRVRWTLYGTSLTWRWRDAQGIPLHPPCPQVV